MSHVASDLKESCRALQRAPGLVITVLLSLGLAIGAATAVFSFVNALQFKALPFHDEARLVSISETSTTDLCAGCAVGTSFPAYEDWRARASSFQHLGAFREERFVVSRGGDPRRVGGARISAGLFQMLGARPALGREFSEDDDRPGGPPVVVINAQLWRERYGAQESALGDLLRVNGIDRTIVGVMPDRFAFPEFAQLWLPLAPTAGNWGRDDRSLSVAGRLKDGVSIRRATVEMRTVAASLAAEHEAHRGWSIQVVPFRESLTGETVVASWVLMAAVGMVLLIACANVANLLLVRASDRRREISIRTTLGAGRARITRLVLTESLILCLPGGLAGVLLAFWISGAVVAMLGTEVPYWIEFAIDRRVLLVGLALALGTGLLCGVPSAMQATVLDLHTELKQGGPAGGHRSGRTMRAILASGQLALALLLLAGAGLLIKTVAHAYQFDIGYDPERVLTGDVELSAPQYDDNDRILAFSRSVIERLERIPDVRAAISRTVFFAGFGSTPRQISVEGMAAAPQGSSPGFYHAVTPGYFEVLGVPFRAGRDFSDADSTGVVIVNEEMARRIWPEGTALGRRIRLGDDTPDTPAPWLTVVGVVANAGGSPFGRRGPSVFAYVPLRGAPGRSLAITVGTTRNPSSLRSELVAAVTAEDPDQPVEDVMTMAQALERWMSPARFMGLLMTSLAGIAVLLAAMGTFGVVAFAVSRRTREIGIRLAIGASPAQVQWLMTKSGLRLLSGGLAVGLPGAALSTRALEGVLAGTSATDPIVFAAVATTLALVALTASWLPARRAARVDPLIVLRSE